MVIEWVKKSVPSFTAGSSSHPVTLGFGSGSGSGLGSGFTFAFPFWVNFAEASPALDVTMIVAERSSSDSFEATFASMLQSPLPDA